MITFPVAVETFIADQEKRVGRKFDDFQRELLGEYVELFNLEFDVGMKGEEPSNVLKIPPSSTPEKASWKSWKSLYLNTSMRVCSIGAMRHIDRERSQEIMNDIITALYHAASSEEPDTMDGPSLCDYYQRREETEQTRRALVDAVGDEVDVDSYGVAMECQGFVNGFRLALGLCVEVI